MSHTEWSSTGEAKVFHTCHLQGSLLPNLAYCSDWRTCFTKCNIYWILPMEDNLYCLVCFVEVCLVCFCSQFLEKMSYPQGHCRSQQPSTSRKWKQEWFLTSKMLSPLVGMFGGSGPGDGRIHNTGTCWLSGSFLACLHKGTWNCAGPNFPTEMLGLIPRRPTSSQFSPMGPSEVRPLLLHHPMWI